MMSMDRFHLVYYSISQPTFMIPIIWYTHLLLFASRLVISCYKYVIQIETKISILSMQASFLFSPLYCISESLGRVAVGLVLWNIVWTASWENTCILIHPIQLIQDTLQKRCHKSTQLTAMHDKQTEQWSTVRVEVKREAKCRAYTSRHVTSSHFMLWEILRARERSEQ
jgi:hypothetical protein